VAGGGGRGAARGPGAPGRAAAAKAAPPKAALVKPAASGAVDDRKTRGRTRARLAERTRPLRVELQQIESRLARIGVERSDTEAALATGGLEPAQIADAGRQLNHIAAETAMLEERWLALSGEIESIEATASR
jgi:ATP-binding cassette subfamily F protein 3